MKFSDVKFIRLLIFKDIFDEPRLEFRAYLKDLPPRYIIKLTIHLLTLGKNYSGANIFRFFNPTAENENKMETGKIFKQIMKIISTEKDGTISFSNSIASLRLIEFALEQDLKNDTSKATWTKEKANEFLIKFFKAYLSINQEIREVQDIEREKHKHLELNQQGYRDYLTQQLSHFDLDNFNLSVVFICQIHKAALFFNFLETDEKLAKLLEGFYRYLGVEGKYQVYKKLVLISQFCFKWLNDDPTFVIDKGSGFMKNTSFVEKLILKEFEEASTDFKLIKKKPIYQLEEGHYLILHALFTIQKMYKSLYFTFSELHQLLPEEEKVSKNFRSYYGQHFSEDYLVSTVLSEILVCYDVKFSGQEIRRRFSNIGEPDYYARNDRSILLFETKDSLFNSDIKTSFNFDLIENEIRKKLYDGGIGSNGSNKTVLQLVKLVEKTKTKTIGFDEINTQDNMEVFPIHIFHDEAFDSAGVNYMVNSWFQNEKKARGLNKSHSLPLVLIHIDTLIIYRNLFIEKKLTLENLIKRYANNHLANSADYVFNPDLLISFSTFIREYVYTNKLTEYLEPTSLNKNIESLTGWKMDGDLSN